MQKDRFNDWLFRYRYIYRSRLSDRSKKIPKCFSDRYLTNKKRYSRNRI